MTNRYGAITQEEWKGAEGEKREVRREYSDKKGNWSTAAKLRRVNDGFDGTVTEFRYNEDDKLQSYVAVREGIQTTVTEETPSNPLTDLDQAWQQGIEIEEPKPPLSERKIKYTNKAWMDGKVLSPKVSKTSTAIQREYGGSSFASSLETDYGYDTLGRPESVRRKYNGSKNAGEQRVTTTLSYLESGETNGTTEYIKSQRTGPLSIEYRYNSRGGIKSVTKNGETQTYAYDKLGRLSEYGSGTDKTIYTYDEMGNVCEKKSITSLGDMTQDVILTYGGNILEGYDGEVIGDYDECWNPRQYRGKEMTWTRGGLLTEYNGVEYTYNKDGRRTGKSARETVYVYEGSKLLSERWTMDGGETAYNYYVYDGAGLAGFTNVIYDGNDRINRAVNADYIVVTDTFGTVHEIRRRWDNDLLARFSYDAWGKCTVEGEAAIAISFPFRWKGYYYDRDTGLYLIATEGGERWYDPDTGRFVSGATVGEIIAGAGRINGLNPYLYNSDDPINAAGSAWGSESEYDLTPMLDKRYTKREMQWRRISFIALCVIGLAGAAAIGGVSIAAGVGAIAAGGIGGIIVGSLTILGSAYLITDSAATLAEAFSCNGYNFMRDGLYGGNAGLQRAMAFAAAAVMTVCSIASVALIKHAQLAKAEMCLKECFKAGTLVLCKDETGGECRKPIEDVEVGDLVRAYDEERGESGWKPVLSLSRNETREWCTIYLEVYDDKGNSITDEITSTLGHKYYVRENKVNRNPNEILEHANYEGLCEKWVSAEDLKKGDKVLVSDGKCGIIIKTEIEHFSEPETTYNFEVQDFHTYYVGERGVCVHNACDWKYADLPDDAKAAYDAYSKNGWQGNIKGQTTNAGSKWGNINHQLLTQDDLGRALSYREFDVGMKIPRGPSRFVVSDQMTVYYTPDHYTTFFRIIGG